MQQLILIAWQKFWYTKYQNLFTISLIALSLLALLITSIGVNSVTETANKITNQNNIRKNLIANYFDTYNKSSLTGNPPAPNNYQQWKEKVKSDLGANNIYISYSVNNLYFFPSTGVGTEAGTTLTLEDYNLVSDKVGENYWKNFETESVPAIIPYQWIYLLEGKNESEFKNPYEKYNFLNKKTNQNLNKYYELFYSKVISGANSSAINSASDRKLVSIKLKAVAFGSQLTLPDWSRNTPAIAQLLNNQGTAVSTVYNYDLGSSTKVSEVLNDLNLRSKYNIAGAASTSDWQKIQEGTGVLQTFGYGAGMLLGVIAFLLLITTISKTIIESGREIALFQSIGLSNFQINFIYVAYTTILSLSGYFLGLFLAYLTLVILSLLKGYEFLNFALNFTERFDQNLPLLPFVSFPFSTLINYLIIIVITSLGASIISIIRQSRNETISQLKY